MKHIGKCSFLFAAALAALCTQAVRADYHGTCYEIFVRSFYDSDGDGIGDLEGVMEKLDYINDGDPATQEDLGCDMIWLMPVFDSPTYHKYDVKDYYTIDPQYLTEKTGKDGQSPAVRKLAEACHDRGISLILDLPLNHTSTQHMWFQSALDYLKDLSPEEEPDAAACPYVDYYNFSREAATGYAQAENMNWYYEARFDAGMPDLNLDSEAVRAEIEKIALFWLEQGVDGFRLDAVTSYYTGDKEKNIAFLRWLNDTIKAVYPDCYLVAEAWTDPSTYAAYYESGIDSLFDFAFAGPEGYIAALAKGKKDASIYGKKLMEEEALFSEHAADAVNAPFYTNHDMARSVGYYTKENSSRTKIAQALNLLMPGNAFLYYGEELGMRGSGRDENKRAPMYWDSDPAAAGMCDGPPEMEEVEMKYGPLREQAGDTNSIYCYVRSVIQTRNAHPAIARGKTTMLETLSGKEACVLLREADGYAPVLLAFNLSKEEIMLDLSADPQAQAFTLLAETLPAADGACSLAQGVLTLPPLSAAVLTCPE